MACVDGKSDPNNNNKYESDEVFIKLAASIQAPQDLFAAELRFKRSYAPQSGEIFDIHKQIEAERNIISVQSEFANVVDSAATVVHFLADVANLLDSHYPANIVAQRFFDTRPRRFDLWQRHLRLHHSAIPRQQLLLGNGTYGYVVPRSHLGGLHCNAFYFKEAQAQNNLELRRGSEISGMRAHVAESNAAVPLGESCGVSPAKVRVPNI